MSIHCKNIKKVYPSGITALSGLNLDVKKGEIITLIGPSGCGKTTLLKMINGLILPTEGEIIVEGKKLERSNTIELRRRIGYVIQQVGLFPHLNIEKNISYVLKIMGRSNNEQKTRAHELINLVGLSDENLKKYPRELSGGQQQRIGVARALAADPPIILMDEPFGAIDEITRKTLQDELLKIQERLKKTIVFVTHDIEEAMKLGDRIALMKDGRVEQVDTPKIMFFKPKTAFVEEFFGTKNFASFMNISHISEVVDRESPNIFTEKPLISSDSVMKGIQRLFREEKRILPVVDEAGVYIGSFSIENAYGPMVEDLKLEKNQANKDKIK